MLFVALQDLIFGKKKKDKDTPKPPEEEAKDPPPLQKKRSNRPLKTPSHYQKPKTTTEQEIEELKESFTCPITGKLIKDPMSTPYGHMYERTEIEKWVRVTGECPITKQRLQMEDLMP